MPTVAAVQLNSGPDVAQNLKAVAACLQQASARGAVLAVLPENFSLMPEQDNERLDHAEVAGDGPVQSFLSEQASRLGMWIIGGTVALRSPDPKRVFNSSLVYDSSGKQVARYDKIHLFDIDLTDSESYRESAFVCSGYRPQLIDTPAGLAGLSICYDLRFPALYNHYSDQGAEVLLVPAAFTVTTGRPHWRTLLQARAIENLAYVVAPAQTGAHPAGRQTWGHSMIVGPWGEVLALREQGVGLITAEIDLDRVADVRQQLPVIRHRRRDLFQDS